MERPGGLRAAHDAQAEREIAAQMVAEAAEAVELILNEGVGKAMTRFNRRVEADRQKIRSERFLEALKLLEQRRRGIEDIWKSVSTT